MGSRLRLVAGLLGVLGALIGVTVLLGWILGSEMLKGGFVQGITMKTNTAICLVLSGVALSLLSFGEPGRGRVLAIRVVSGLVIAIALAILSQYLVGWNLGIDQLLFHEAAGAAGTQAPNRMSPPASISFTLLALAFASLTRRRYGNLHEKLALAVMLISSVAVLGYLFGAPELYGVGRYTGIAFVTGASLLLLAVGTLCVRPEAGIAHRLQAQDSGALLTRRLLPAAIILPIVLTALRIAGQDMGFYDNEFGRALLVLGFIVVFTGLIWQTGLAVSRQERTASRSEAELQRRLIETLQALQEADRRKDNFLATLAHELRNPLAPVRNSVHMLRLQKPRDPETEWAHAVIDRQVDHLARLIEDLVDVSRVTRGLLELRRSPIRLSEVIETAVESIESDVEAAGHHLAVNVPEEPLVIDGDPVRLTQIFTNLLSNAVKYTPPGGRVRLSAERLEREAVVRVSDDGNGIASVHLPHVFEMFYQTEGVLERTQGGLGIGLALVRHLVGLHGGSVEAHSDGPGRGSEFTVRFPLVLEVAAPRPETDGEALPHLAGRRVLVVDDNEDAAASLGVLLAHAGAEIFTADDGEEAISIAARVRPDVVLLDIGLPKINGYDVARVIREGLGSSAVLIAVTGWGQDGDRERSKEAGFDHHLIKPVRPEALLRLVRDLDGSSADETEPTEPFPA